ncbi:DUF5753 domain-containing protein [Amycolatopsis sp. FBCC-B4732]|uniref:Scr1 family TA system antitoxin-like transcriptional regulator n=1 Tax=Amycolatopsis sp. FBCC-B4732 TaxID=3079339 RepID=UPI001FF1B3BB|nr:Scr1 family TA system antitoxin-like transcriptional regulator [Amycolatopsis sp. FBCC-B4732]UOX87203.1 DUF5753 domain-containing protein [Amycolatopsis sp. FBCC-B4732]
MKQIVDLANRADDADLIVHTEHDEDLLHISFEQLSTLVFEWSPTLFPNRLRSAAYSRAIQESSLPNPVATSENLVPAPARISSSDGPEPFYAFLLGESATRPDACSPSVLYDQIEEVATVSKLLRLSVGLVPAAFCPPGLVEPFTIYEDRIGPFAVSVPHHSGVAFLTDQAAVKRYAKTANWLRGGITDDLWS